MHYLSQVWLYKALYEYNNHGLFTHIIMVIKHHSDSFFHRSRSLKLELQADLKWQPNQLRVMKSMKGNTTLWVSVSLPIGQKLEFPSDIFTARLFLSCLLFLALFLVLVCAFYFKCKNFSNILYSLHSNEHSHIVIVKCSWIMLIVNVVNCPVDIHDTICLKVVGKYEQLEKDCSYRGFKSKYFC